MSSHSSDKQGVAKPSVPAKPGTSVQGSSGPEPGSQTLSQQSTSQDALDITASASQGTSSHYQTGVDSFHQPYPMTFTGPPEADDIPLSETHDSDEEFSGSVSD